MKISEMRECTIEELNEEIFNIRKTLFDLRISKSTYKLESTAEISKLRSQISRMKTVIREKQLNNQ